MNQEQTINTNIQVTSGEAFPFNATQRYVPVNIAPAGEKPHWAKFLLRRPEREELMERERDATTETKPVSGGESIIVTNEEAANIALFDKIAKSVSGLTRDGLETELTSALLKRLEPGFKNKAILGYYSGFAKLENWSAEMFFLDTDSQSDYRVRHELGSRNEPDFILTWHFAKPEELVRADYRLNSLQVRSGGGGRKAKSKLVTDLNVAIRTFKSIFRGVENGVLVEADRTIVPYSEERREDFLQAIDPVLMSQAIDPVMSASEGNLSD